MNYATIKNTIMRKQKGAFSSVLWERPMKTLKAFSGETIIKRTRATVRCGIEYDNIGAVRVARVMGDIPPVNAGLSWGEWAQYPYFIQHNGQKYLRVATVPGTRTRTEYFHNGVRVDKAAIAGMCLKSETVEKEAPPVFTIKTDNILAIR